MPDLAEELCDELSAAAGDFEAVLASDASHADGTPVRIHIHRRAGKIDIDDGGEAARRTACGQDWLIAGWSFVGPMGQSKLQPSRGMRVAALRTAGR
jgi:hypothetical protein